MTMTRAALCLVLLGSTACTASVEEAGSTAAAVEVRATNEGSDAMPFGFHDCSSEADGQTATGRPCDAAFSDFVRASGGNGWVTLFGSVGGTFRSDYKPAGTPLCLTEQCVPKGTRILLRLDAGDHGGAPGGSLPSERCNADYDTYAARIVDYLKKTPGAARVPYVVLGNEPNQSHAEYEPWNDAWTREDACDSRGGPAIDPDGLRGVDGVADHGVATCDVSNTNPDIAPVRIQPMHPKRYARLFVAVARAMKAAGLPQKLVTAPLIPNQYPWDWSAYRVISTSQICRSYSIGDYLAAITARALGETLIGGIGLHLQGAPIVKWNADHLRVGDLDETTQWTHDFLERSLDAMHVTTDVRPAEAGMVQVVATSKNAVPELASLPVLLKELHPDWPHWSPPADDPLTEDARRNYAGLVRDWTARSSLVLLAHNAANGRHRIAGATFYRWWGTGPQSIAPAGGIRDAVRAGIRDALVATNVVTDSGCRTFASADPKMRATFDETGQTTSGPFYSFWNAHGGLGVFGFPLGAPRCETNQNGDMVYTQWFERQRMEWNPDVPSDSHVLLGFLGRERAAVTREGSPNLPAGYAVNVVTSATAMDPAFVADWRSASASGLAPEQLFGWPLGPAFPSTCSSGGVGGPCLVQYTERARFEKHGNAVFRGPLGVELRP